MLTGLGGCTSLTANYNSAFRGLHIDLLNLAKLQIKNGRKTCDRLDVGYLSDMFNGEIFSPYSTTRLRWDENKAYILTSDGSVRYEADLV